MNIQLEKIDSTATIVESDPEIEMKNFFRTPALIWWIIIPVGLLITFLACIDPKVLENGFFPVIGPFASYIGHEMPDFVKFVALIATLLHVAEAIYATLTCLTHQMNLPHTILWTVQTFIIGFPSLHLLISGVQKTK